MLHRRAVSESGHVAINRNGALARLQVAGRKVNGPQRSTKAEAQADLDRARKCASHEKMATILEQLRAVAGNLVVSHRDFSAPQVEEPKKKKKAAEEEEEAEAPPKKKKKNPSEPSIKRQRTKGTPSSVVSQSAFLSLGASSRGLCRNEEDTISTSAAASSGLPVCLPGATHSLAQSLCLRGLNVQYPFSQLILEGLKVKEARTYKLGKRNIAHPGEEMFLIETPGSRRAAGALVEGRPYDKQAFPLERLSSVFRKGIRP